MKKNIKCFLSLILATIAISLIIGCNKTERNEIGRFAKNDEIIGFWKLVPLPKEASDKLNKVNPWPQTYQWFGIYDDGKMFSFMSSKDQNISAKELDQTFKALPSSLAYKYENGFLMVKNEEIKNYGELWGVNYMLVETKIGGVLPVSQGDLMMSLQGTKEQGVIYYRHLRKIN